MNDDGKITYEYFGPDGERDTRRMTQERAAQTIGERVLVGFDVVTRYLEDRTGGHYRITYFQSDITGKVWSIYH